MPKKSTRNVREQRIDKRHDVSKTSSAEVIVKHFRSIHISVRNAKRWFYVKKRLSFVTDDELAAYLLDLAEPIIRRDGKCTDSEDWQTDRDKENDSEVAKVDDGESLSGEEPLRRSPRKQFIPVATEAPAVETEQRICSESSQLEVPSIEAEPRDKRRSRTKHRRAKAKHHRDKRGKKKHSKNGDEDKNVASLEAEGRGSSRRDSELSGEISKIHNANFASVPTLIVERLSVKEREVRSRSRESESRVAAETENVEKKKDGSIEFFDDETTSNINDVEAKKLSTDRERFTDRESNCSFENREKITVETNYGVGENIERNGLIDNFVDKAEISSTNLREEKEVVASPVNERTKSNDEKRPKKKRKHAKQESPQVEKEGCVSSVVAVTGTLHKRHKRKHKHATDHRAKRCHDVRKAPHDGKVAASDCVETNETSRDVSVTTIPSGVVQTLGDVESIGGEPQRLAIKIKLCQDCNDRHVEDACPLVSTECAITDAVSYKDWLNVHKHNPEVLKAMGTDDPMSEGYAIPNDEAFESDDETAAGEQYKNKTKVESEEKQLHVNEDRPLYARESLPDCFELRITSSEHGIGIYARQSLPIYAKLGPLVGDPVKEMDIPDDFSMRHIWEIDDDGKTSYISTTNPLKSNWIRYMRPADSKDERTVAVVTKRGELHLVTTQNITMGMELTYWADSQSSTWTRKNKIDKTNCGGCNLNFTHPIYYRLHCCIFHDTNYSLTIRKYHCKICGAAVLGKDNIMKHAAELHGGRGAYQCQYCRKFFLRLNYLEMHRTYGCSQNPQRSRPLCDFCGRKFCQPQKLKVHIKRMHSDMSEVLREFQCKSCLKLLGSRAALQRHMKEVHHKDVVAAATCDRCGKMFQNKSNLKIHMLTHSGVKPFKCKENDCKAAFTTKQCLQFHYKKVHGLSEEMMPKIERSVAYTFDAYSGGLVEDVGRGKSQRSGRRGLQQDNSNSLLSLDDCSSEHSSRADVSMSSFHATINDFETGVTGTPHCGSDREIQDRDLQEPEPQEHDTADRELEDSSPSPMPPPSHSEIQMPAPSDSALENIRTSSDVDFYGSSRLQSKGSKKWMGEFNPPNDADLMSQQSHHSIPQSRSDVYEFEEKKDDTRNDAVSAAQAMMNDSKLGLNIYRRPESTNASLLVEAALDAAERDIGAVSSPILDDNDRDGNLYSISSQLQSPMPSRSSESHLDSYIQQQEDLMSPAATPDSRKTPPSHAQIDYHLHRPVDYINSPRTHSIEQYLPQDELPRVSSPGGYIHIAQEDLTSPSATPNPNRYPDIHHHHHHHHHQVPTDNLSSDEGDSVAQNLSLSVKEKSLQLDLSTSYKYDGLETEFCRERGSFEPLVINNGELQGLDMSARGFHHGIGTQIPNNRYHHHLYEITERQSVDLSRTSGYSISPPPSYPHSEVLRIVSLDLTPGHSVDLSLSRSHHLHGNGTRVITSPQPTGSNASHVVPDTIEGRILSPPPPSISGYNATYPVSPAPYHPPRPGYHHYSGYY